MPGFHRVASSPVRRSWVARSILAGMLFLAAVANAVASDWEARHNLTGAQYQATFTALLGKGYRLVSVSGYDDGQGQARYAAVWKRQAGPAWIALHGLTSAQYQAAFEDALKKGYRLDFVTGYAVGATPYFAAIWSKRGGPAWEARHNLTAAQYQAAVDELQAKGYGLRHVSAYTVGGTARFAAIFEKGGPAWVARHALSAEQYQKAFDQYLQQGYRLQVASGYRDGGSDRYAALWTRVGGPAWLARNGIPASQYQAVFDDQTRQRWEPDYVQAFNSSTGVRFNALWRHGGR
jgi:hypothetical protein